MFHKYICSLMSIQKQSWLSCLLLRQQLPNGGETVSLFSGFGEDPLHTHPKRHKFFSSTHQTLWKDNNSNHCILSLERGPKSSNLKGCNQAILEANQCSSQSGLQLLLQEVLYLIGAMRWNLILHEFAIFVRIHCYNSREYVIMGMLQVGGSIDFDSISTNNEKLTNTFPGYHKHSTSIQLRWTSVLVAHLSWDHWNKLSCFGN